MADARIDTIRSVIGLLEHVRANPGMYFRHTEPAHADDFLRGLTIGVGVAIGTSPHSVIGREAILAARGWKHTSVGPAVQMARKRMTPEGIVDELIAIEIEGWHLLLSSIASESPDVAVGPVSPQTATPMESNSQRS